MKYYKLWKVKNGWIAVPDTEDIPDARYGGQSNMEICTVHHSLRAFSDYVKTEEKRTVAAKFKIKSAA